MQFSKILSSFACLLATSTAIAIPAPIATELIETRQSDFTPIDTAPLFLGACLAVGYCYYDGNQKGCYTTGCGNSSLLGNVCSCNVDVQKTLDIQTQKGRAQWPLKCTY